MNDQNYTNMKLESKFIEPVHVESYASKNKKIVAKLDESAFFINQELEKGNTNVVEEEKNKRNELLNQLHNNKQQQMLEEKENFIKELGNLYEENLIKTRIYQIKKDYDSLKKCSDNRESIFNQYLEISGLFSKENLSIEDKISILENKRKELDQSILKNDTSAPWENTNLMIEFTMISDEIGRLNCILRDNKLVA